MFSPTGFKAQVIEASKSHPSFDEANSRFLANEFGFDPAYVLGEVREERESFLLRLQGARTLEELFAVLGKGR